MSGRPARIFILTGAGISADSGVPTFRDADGLWEGHRVEDVATPEGFARNPRLVQEFYNFRRRAILAVEPNPAHMALARLQREHRGEVMLVTQNIDPLHERGGSRNVIHMHGELLKVRCTCCQEALEWESDIETDSRCPGCGECGYLRPHVVWFGEMPLRMEEIFSFLRCADIFIAIGTSGQVYPAAGFVEEARWAGAKTIECNREETMLSVLFDEHRLGLAGVEVPGLVDDLLG